MSAAFVQKHLCGGTDQFVGTRKLNEETAYTLPDGATGLPKLDNSGYQMLTVHQGLAWTFSDLIDDGAREFRVIYADSHRAVRKDKTLTETEATAEAHLEAKAAEAKVDAGKGTVAASTCRGTAATAEWRTCEATVVFEAPDGGLGDFSDDSPLFLQVRSHVAGGGTVFLDDLDLRPAAKHARSIA